MADFETRKISQLPPAGIAVREDKLEVSRTGATWSVTAGQLADLADLSDYVLKTGDTMTGDLMVGDSYIGTMGFVEMTGADPGFGIVRTSNPANQTTWAVGVNPSPGSCGFFAMADGYSAVLHEWLFNRDGSTTLPGALTGTTADFNGGTINITSGSAFGTLEISGPSGAYIDMKAPSSDDFDIRILTNGTTASWGGVPLYFTNASVEISGPLTGTTAAFTGTVTGVTEAAGTNNTRLASTAFVNTAVAGVVGGATPAGPAGGDLAGTYPNPTIKPSVTLTGTTTLSGPLTGTTATFTSITAQTGTNPVFVWNNSDNGVDLKKWDFFEWDDGNLYFRALTDAGAAQRTWEYKRDGSTTLPGALTGTTAVFTAPDDTPLLRTAGATKGIRIKHLSDGSYIEGVDNTHVTSYQPLTLHASQINITAPLSAMSATFSGTVFAPGAQLQMVSTQTGAVATGTTTIPADNTIPQQTEGDQYMSLAITPKSATSKLVIEVTGVWANSGAAGYIIAALFQDSTANALAAMLQYQSLSNAPQNIKFSHTMTSGTTGATTFKVRAGYSVAGTTFFNGNTGPAQFMGGVMASSIVIREIAT